jgi:arylsulfatase A
VTVAQLLRQAGYGTGLFGKWHLGKYPGYQPQDRGFDQFFGHYHGHIERYEFPDQVYHNGRPVEARGYVSDLFTDASIDFIEHSVQQQKPFFCALMYNAPHSPWLLDTSHAAQPEGDKLLTKYLDRGLPMREARIYALIDRVDQNIGRLLGKLDAFGAAENTVVIFTSDNGGVSKYWKGGMNGQKAGVYEGGVRAPCFVRWPGVIPSGTHAKAQTSHVDWLPTFCELAGARLPDDRAIDGKSLVPILKAGQGDQHHAYVYHTWDRYFPNAEKRWGISDSRWKLLCQVGQEAEPSESSWRLFDLQADPGEETNLANQYPEVVQKLRAEFVRWFTDATRGIDYAPIRIPVGHPNEPTAEISPSWAVWSGKHVRYTFNGYDWDTIDGWKDPGEKATWRLDVQTEGTYKVQLSYGCRPLDQGGTLRMRIGDNSIDHQVHATTTAEQFETFDAGLIDLPKGEIQLVAEVVDAPGNELMRLNKVTLQPVKRH